MSKMIFESVFMTGVNESVYIVKHFTTRTCSDVPFLCSDCDCFHNDTHGYVVYTRVRVCVRACACACV